MRRRLKLNRYHPKPPRPRLDRLAALAVAFLGGLMSGATVASACGPLFPNRYLDASAERLLSAPEAFFADEIMRLQPVETPRMKARNSDSDSEDEGPSPEERRMRIEEADFAMALRARGDEAGEIEARVAAYLEARASGLPAPEWVPLEFALYQRGALAWREGRPEVARAAWRELISLPSEARRMRGVWAAYMLGRSELVLPDDEDLSVPIVRDSDEALKWFAEARRLAAAGAEDSAGLAGEAKGWMARIRLDRGEWQDAAELYFERLAEGDETALQSLRWTARRMVKSAYGEQMEACARDAQMRGLVVAWLLSRGVSDFDWETGDDWPAKAREWAMVIRRVGASNLRGADRLGWLAYEGGLFGLAEEWLALAEADSAEAEWLRAKLFLRGGDLEAGIGALRRSLAAEKMPLVATHREQLWGELGRALLAVDRPTEALLSYLDGGHWEDAAYVAERVLTLDELVAFVNALPEQQNEEDAVSSEMEMPLPVRLRNLAARRLLREGREQQAMAYFPQVLRAEAEAYLTDVNTGFDVTKPMQIRVDALWRAATTLRERGLELTATELEPDWAIWSAQFDMGSSATSRLEEPVWEGGTFAPTKFEQARLGVNLAPKRRFHYRYEAAQLAWWAASLSPDEAVATARMLWEAGGWLKARDPKSAEPFYQALVLRCGNTVTGREAKVRRWFPDDWQE